MYTIYLIYISILHALYVANFYRSYYIIHHCTVRSLYLELILGFVDRSVAEHINFDLSLILLRLGALYQRLSDSMVRF